MASLALLVSVIVFWIIVSGPICMIISCVDFIPNTVVWTFSIITIMCGLWFFSLPIPAIRYIGLLSCLLAFFAIRHRQTKTKG